MRLPRVLPALLSFAGTLAAQSAPDTLRLTLDEAVLLAQSESPSAAVARTRLSNRYWFYQSALADFKPQIDLAGTVPLLNRSIEPIVLPDGDEAFVQRALMRNSLALSISQEIPLTGGTVFASTGLERLDIFKQDGEPGRTSYLSTPISIGYRQGLSGYNALKFARRRAPLEYREAELRFREDREDLALQAARGFFDVLSSELALAAARTRRDNADTLLAVSQGRFSVGRIAETELLVIELAALNANTEVEQARVELRRDTEALRNFLGLRETVAFAPIAPAQLPEFSVDADTALAYARANRSEIVGYRRRLLEAEEENTAARAESGIAGDLFVNFRLSQTAADLGDAYVDPLDNEQLTLGLSVPIADFGKRRARREVAESNAELARLTTEQEEIALEQNVLLLVRQFDLLRNNVGLARRAYEVAERGLDITRRRYLIGKIGITDLTVAIDQQERARSLYIEALRAFWLGYYELRLNTLYDFRAGRGLNTD